MGFGLSTLYQSSDRTRWGLSYQSEIQSDQEGSNDLSGLGPNTQAEMERLGIIDADITIESATPQSLLVGVYHELDNDHAFTVDIAWIDFSSFTLSEYYFNGESFAEPDSNYKDIYALSGSYSWPISDRWMLGVGGCHQPDDR